MIDRNRGRILKLNQIVNSVFFLYCIIKTKRDEKGFQIGSKRSQVFLSSINLEGCGEQLLHDLGENLEALSILSAQLAKHQPVLAGKCL